MVPVTILHGHANPHERTTAHHDPPHAPTRTQQAARDRRQHAPTSRHHRTAPAIEQRAAPDPLLTIAEILVEIKVARSTFDTWRSLGSAPECIKLPNGQIRVRRSALESWLAALIEMTEAS